jgi:hypothetical protein
MTNQGGKMRHWAFRFAVAIDSPINCDSLRWALIRYGECDADRRQWNRQFDIVGLAAFEGAARQQASSSSGVSIQGAK